VNGGAVEAAGAEIGQGLVRVPMPISGAWRRKSMPSCQARLAAERRSRIDLRRDVMGAFVPPPALWAVGRLCTGAKTAAGRRLMFATWRSCQPLRRFDFARAGDRFRRARLSL
jgi:hypothetical protein